MLRYMLIESCEDCNMRGTQATSKISVCCVTGTIVDKFWKCEPGMERFPPDCPLKKADDSMLYRP